jgi:CBS domain-containing protein
LRAANGLRGSGHDRSARPVERKLLDPGVVNGERQSRENGIGIAGQPDPIAAGDEAGPQLAALGALGAALQLDPTQRARVTFFADEAWVSEVSFYCPVRDRAQSLEECRACRHCRPDGDTADAPVGCGDPLARRFSGEALLRAPRPRSLADRTALWQVMRPCVICVRPDLRIDALMTLLIGFDLRGVPVVDDGGRPIGVVSRSDLVEHWYECEVGGPALRARAPNGGPGEHLGPGFHATPAAQTVADVMMSVAFTLREDSSLSHAAALMAYEGVHRIPVVSFEGKVVGIVSSMDVVRWLAQHDGYVVPDSRSRDA